MRKPKAVFALSLLLVISCLALQAGCGEGPALTLPKTQPDRPDRPEDGETTERSAPAQSIYTFYQAIDEGRYEDAYELTTEQYRENLSLEQFESLYRNYVESVRVLEVTGLPEYSEEWREEYRVDFEATYLQNYPAGSGELPMFHILVPDPSDPDRWLIDGMGTAP